MTGEAEVSVMNREPVAVPDTYTTPEGVPLVVAAPGILANDFDPDGDPITFSSFTFPANGTVTDAAPNGQFSYTPDPGFAGTDIIEYRITDGSNLSLLGAIAILVLPANNDAPIADAGEDQTVECAGPSGAVIALNGSGSSDADGDMLTYTWTGPFPEGGGMIGGVNPTITLSTGVHAISLMVEDPSGASDTDEVVITVEDTAAPVLSVGVAPLVLWPSNGKYRTVALDALALSATDACDAGISAAATVVAEVSSDEHETGPGFGNTSDDIVIAGDCASVQVRAERQGSGDGRVYTLVLELADGEGNVGTAAFEVYVPKEPRLPAVAGPVAYTVSGCEAAPVATVASAAIQKSSSGSTAAEAKVAQNLATEALPEAFALSAAYPNPFRSVATLSFNVPEPGQVQLVVYDILGREVVRLVDGPVAAGRHTARLDAADLPSGIYLVRMMAEGRFAETQQLVLLR